MINISSPVRMDISQAELFDNPYPAFKIMQDTASVVYVPSVDIHLVTRSADIKEVEANPARFSSSNPISLMNKVMGHSLMRKDFEEHAVERKAISATFSQKAIKTHWHFRATSIAQELIDGIKTNGRANLFSDFAAPFAAKLLLELVGFDDVSVDEIAIWSQTLMDGVSNYINDDKVRIRAEAAARATKCAIERASAAQFGDEDFSVLASVANSGIPHTPEQIHANVNVIVGGGLNEPRDAILSMVLGLLRNPTQLEKVKSDPTLWALAFEEAVRWISPIGMYPRMVQEDTILGDTRLMKGTQLGICVGAANREVSEFEDPDNFDVFRKRKQNLAFGAGPHFCAGTFVARMAVGRVAVPMLFEQLKNLQLDQSTRPEIKGWVFRGPTSLPVVWDAH